jgi:hypothetical protein
MSTMLVKAQVSEADVIHLKPGQMPGLRCWATRRRAMKAC